MTNSEKLARWQGWEPYDRGGWCSPNQRWSKSYPDYPNDDSAAMSLLDTLAERGYKVQLVSSLLAEFVTWDCFVTYAPNKTTQGSMGVQTRSEAVVAAVLEMIGKEDV